MSKRVVVIGSGGREHAICWKLAKSKQVSKVYALPGSYGIAKVDKCTSVGADVVDSNDFQAVAVWCKSNKINLVIVGPEDPLANGICDVLRNAGVSCFGPNRNGAQIESDKKWSKDFMQKYGIPTARYQTFKNVQIAKEFVVKSNYQGFVVKATGLAAGKGVIVAANKQEAFNAIDEILGEKKFGTAGDTIIVEELLFGQEVSILALADGTTIEPLLPAQDHKRLCDNDLGPNTGGMGAYCPCPLIDDKMSKIIESEVIKKTLDGLLTEHINYVGVLYFGLMITEDGPKVLEYNCRFGDPETQVVLPLLKSDFYAAIESCVLGKLKDCKLEWLSGMSAVGVVMASAGYPEMSTKGCRIKGLPKKNTETMLVFHSAITVNSKGESLTNGGRVLIVVSLEAHLMKAATRATKLCQEITFKGGDAQFRTDIAAKGFNLNSSSSSSQPLTYKSSGVDIDAGDALVKNIKKLTDVKHRRGVIGGIGGFGGLLRLNEFDYQSPVVCEATNGVGSKIMVASSEKLYEGIGRDLVAMCANDLLESGAEPVAFLDYYACGRLEVAVASQIVKGIVDCCRDANVALLGGETAEMPGMYSRDNFDLAGYCMGLVELGKELPRTDLYEHGDQLIALPSSGLHCAGFNDLLPGLNAKGIDLSSKCEFFETPLTLGQVLGTPTNIYVNDVLPLLKNGEVKAIAHVTRGLVKDVARIMHKYFEVTLDFENINLPEVFGWLAAKVNLSPEALLHQHNCGVGLVLVVSKECTAWSNIPGSKVLGVLKRQLRQKSREKVNMLDFITVKNFEKALNVVASKYGGIGEYTPEKTKDLHKLARNCYFRKAQRKETYTTQLGRRLTCVPKRFEDPVLVMGTDGVGTKLLIAQEAGEPNTVGIDLVAMCVNDILCVSAEPLTFTAYYACGDVSQKLAKKIIGGVVNGANQANCSITGVHIAEVPLLYNPSVYDLAGFSLGVTSRELLMPKLQEIRADDVVIGLPSSGVHSNGFSLVRAVMQRANVSSNQLMPGGFRYFYEELLKPTKIYVKPLLPLLEAKHIKAMAHITGGGLLENIPRVLPDTLSVHLNAKNYTVPNIFAWLQKAGDLSMDEMLRTFNCGLGLIIIVEEGYQSEVFSALKLTERAEIVGKVIRRGFTKPPVFVENFEECVKGTSPIIKSMYRKRVAVFISGNGTNMEALIKAGNDTSQGMDYFIAMVICNKENAGGITIARRYNVPVEIMKNSDYKTREEYDSAITAKLITGRIDYICLAGFMRVLSAPFVRQWHGRVLNIHPSLLPKYPGMNAQKQAFDAGDLLTGCTVHFVDEGVDTGAIIMQELVDVFADDTLSTLTKRIHEAEHYTYPRALNLVASEKIVLGQDGKLNQITTKLK